MEKITLYRFNRPDGGVSVSPVKPDGDFTELTRLVADDGMLLTDGESYVSCIDTETPSAWSEIPDPGDEATDEDYQNALREMGVEV